MIFNFKQKKQNIVEYIREKDQTNAEYPKNFQDMLDYQFIVEFEDKRKNDLIYVYLGVGKSTVKYTKAKQAIEKAY